MSDEPGPERTGDDAVDAALEELDGLADQPLDAHVRAAERVHQRLQTRLSDLGDD